MRTLILLILSVIMVAASGCRNSNDVIAGMKSGRIYRFEFHNWLKARGINPAELYNDQEKSEEQLKQMAVEILSVEKALSDKFNTTSFYTNINSVIYANFLSSYFKSEIKKKLDYAETAVEIKLIKLYIPADLNTGTNRAVFSDKLSLAGYIIQQYKNGADFNRLCLKYSEHGNNGSAYESEIIPMVFLDAGIVKEIKNLKDGECIPEPVVMRDSIVIVKLIRRLTLTGENAEKLINREEIYNRFIDYLSEGTVEYVIAESGADLKVVSNIENAGFKMKNESLFSINGKSFTSGELDEVLRLFVFLKYGGGELTPDTVLKRNTARNILNEYILSSGAEKKGICNHKDFKEKWGYISKSILAGAYKYYILSGKITGDNLSSDKKNGPGSVIPDINIDYNRFVNKDSAGNDFPSNKIIEERKINWEKNLLNSNSFMIYRDSFF